MKSAIRKPNFLSYSLGLLFYKKRITFLNIFCNAIIFSHQAAVNFCVMQVLNTLETAQGFALEKLIPYLVGILIAAAIRVAAIMGCAALDALRSFYYRNRVRTNGLRLLLKKDDITYVSGHAAAVFEALSNDVSISTFPAELLTEVSGYFVYTLIALSMLLTINWQLTLFIFLPLSAAVYGIQRLSERMKERRQENRAAHDVSSSFVGDVFNTVLAIKWSGAEASVLDHYDNVNEHRRSAELKDTLFAAKTGVMLYGVVYVGSAIIMFAASRLMTGGAFGLGDFGLFIANLGTLADCVNRIVELVTESRKAEVSYQRILNIVGADKAEMLNADAALTLRPNKPKCQERYDQQPLHTFEVRNLSYSYANGRGFRNVSFRVQPGELTVVTGGVGSGKSALLSVLMGLYPPDGGEMLLDGKPLLPCGRIPVSVAGAPQRAGFFSKSFEDNLCLGFQASPDEMKRALSIASFPELISGNAHGFAASIGARGDKLSGGQLQRLAVARVLVRGAQLNVIDDCVSALDEGTRRKMLLHLVEYMKKTSRSVVIATNERTFLEAANQILHMEQGRLVSQSSFAEFKGLFLE